MSPIKKEVVIGECRLLLGSCEEILPVLDRVDAILTDPPYGIGQDKGFEGFESFGGFGPPIARRQYRGEWDNARPSKELLNLIINAGNYSIIFGGNYFADVLPLGQHWLVWDKKNTMPTFSDCELAWTNLPRKSVKLLTYEYNGLIGKRETRVHPTQKPVEVMQWCLRGLPKGTQTILDPFMGSGTTLVACAKLGRKGIGIEIDPDYFEIACKRVRDAYAQPDMFIEPPKQEIKQEALEL